MLDKDENFVKSYELRMTVHMVSPFLEACQKFTGLKVFIYIHKSQTVSCGIKRTQSRL